MELLWMARWAEKLWGFRPKPLSRRPEPDTQAIQAAVSIDASVETAWAVITDHEGMTAWNPLGAVKRITDGASEPDGYGSERLLSTPIGPAVEQVVHFDPPRVDRYRVIKGSPFVCRQGEIRLSPHGEQTDLTWTVRFRPKLSGTGPLLAAGFFWMLDHMLRTRLKPHIESRTTSQTGIGLPKPRPRSSG